MPLPTALATIRMTGNLPLHGLQTLFDAPEFFPVRFDFKKRVAAFVRMSRETYRRSVFLDDRTIRHGNDIYGVRLDDLLLKAGSAERLSRKLHYIFHPTFSCSTLLARYFELMPACLVLKEPLILTQMALTPCESIPDWSELLQLCVRLLTRSFTPGGAVVIKPHEPVNGLADRLLGNDPDATCTFLLSPLKQFVVSMLKTQSRRTWVRTRIPAAANVSQCSPLMSITPDMLTDAEAAAYLWLVSRFVCEQCCGRHPGRTLFLDPNRLADSPEAALKDITSHAKLTLSPSRLKTILDDPSIQAYSKDPSRPYNALSRRVELDDLERQYGPEAESARRWAISAGMEEYIV
jgi:hypothetical protein